VPARLWQDFTSAALTGRPVAPLPPPAHVGRSDVGDAGQSHGGGKSPDEVSGRHDAAAGYEPVVHTAHGGKRLALTFDDGPSDYTPAVLDLLAKYHIKATFCMVGEQVEAYPNTVRRIVAEGHELCNHSMRHDDLGIISAAKARADIAATDAAIAEAVPGATVTYYRAPYGDFGTSAKEGALLGHTPLGWLVDPDDWMLPGADVIASRIEQQLTPRAVVLVHDGGGEREQTIAALKKVIPRLLGQGWTFDLPKVTISAHPLPGPTSASPSTTPPTPPSASPEPSGPIPPPDAPAAGKPTTAPELTPDPPA
jgi:peptidoglycan/xylan/chitin deacetylase (PgdA/CDA1 family)